MYAVVFPFCLSVCVQAVLNHGEIKEAMMRKVSRERIGIEVRKMLSGKDPARAFNLLAEYGLLDLVFNDLNQDETTSSDGAAPSPRLWTKDVEAKALEHLHFLQQSRLALAGHQISFVESSGAILTPLFLAPESIASISGPPSLESLATTDEETIIKSAFSFLSERDAVTRRLPIEEIVEMLKTNVKWPKPAAKRVAFIVEAVAAFPSNAQFSHESPKGDRLKLFMWMTRYNSVIAPAMSILLTKCGPSAHRDATLKAFLDLGAVYAKREAEQGKKRRMDGNVIKTHLGDNAGPKISRALEVLNVWEMVHPAASVDEELAFLQRLAPQLE